MFWTVSWLLLAAALGGYAAFYFTWKEAIARNAAQSVALQARMRYQQATISPSTVVENFTCGWLNLLLKFMWPGFLVNIANGVATSQLVTLFDNLSKSLAARPIFRVAFSKMILREFCLGAVPPEFDNATVRIMPKEMMMEVEVDVHWPTCGQHMVLDSLVTVGEQQWNMKLLGMEVLLRGRMLFVLHLSKSILPGVSGFQFSFVRKPQLTFDIKLKGMLFSEIPGLVPELKRRLVNIIANEAVEPSRVWISLDRTFFNLVTRKQAGCKGQLKIVLQHGTDLKPTYTDSGPAEARDGEQVMCFVEMLVLGRPYVSPIAPQGSHPRWDFAFYVPMEGLPTEKGAVVARFTVRNFMAREQPQIIGVGELHMDSFDAQALTRAEPAPARVRLKSPKDRKGGGGNLHVSLHYDPSAARAPDGPAAPAIAAPSGTTQPPRAAALPTVHEAAMEDDDDEEGGEIHTDHPYPSDHMQDTERLTGAFNDTASVSSRGQAQGRGELATLTAVTRSEVQTELDGRMHAVASRGAHKRVAALEQALKLEMRRRHEEELRALLEGAPFIMHRGSDKLLRHVWVQDLPDKKCAQLRWQSNKGISLSRLKRMDKVTAAKLQYHEAPVTLLTSVTYGNDLFPEVQYHNARGSAKPGPLSKEKCFSVLIKVQGEQPADEVTVALHLEIPPHGNGRSRNEWVSAFNSLMCHKLPIYQPESSADVEEEEDAVTA